MSADYILAFRSVKNVVYLRRNSCICCPWQRLFTWLGFMCLVRLCHENCIKKNYGFVECQLCAVKMVEGGGGCWQCFFWQEVRNVSPGHSPLAFPLPLFSLCPTLASIFQPLEKCACGSRKHHWSSVSFCSSLHFCGFRKPWTGTSLFSQEVSLRTT